MSEPNEQVYEFDSICVDSMNRKLSRDGRSVPLTPLAFNTLIFFLENSGRLVTKSELLTALWPDTFVDEGNVTYIVSVVRKALGDSGHAQKYIETVAKSGYRFTAPLRRVKPAETRQTEPGACASVAPAIAWNRQNAALALGVILLALISRETPKLAPESGPIVIQRGRVSSTISNVTKFAPAISTAARGWYLKGRYSWSRGTEKGLKQSIVFFTNAIAEEPHNALAYAGLADAYGSLATWSVQSSEVSYRAARDSAQRAVQLDSSLSQAHSALGNVEMVHDWNFPLAEQEFRRAVALGPNDPIAHQRLGRYFAATSDFPNALREVRIARDLDPLSFDIGTTLGLIYFYARQYDQAMAEYRKLIDLDPHYSVAHYRLGETYFVQGDYQRAIPELQESSRLVNDREPLALGLYAAARARNGDRAGAQAILSELLARSRKEYISPVGVGLLYLALDQENEAMQWIDKMFQDRIVTAVFAGVNPLFDSLRSDPRFVAYLKQVNATPSTPFRQIFHLASR